MSKIPKLYNMINDLHASVPKAFGNGYALPPLRVGCVLTHRCNLRCSMCFVWKRGTAELKKNELTTDEWNQIFSQIPRFAIITFTGGEPLVRQDLPELLDSACSNHRVHLVSNGTMLSDERIQQAVSLAPGNLFGKGLLSLGISLEGPSDVHDSMVGIPGAFEKTTTALKKLVELKRERNQAYPLLDLKIVICKENYTSLVKLYDLADELGLDIISFQQCSTQESSYGIDDANPDAMKTAPPQVDVINHSDLLNELNALTTRAASGKTTLRFNPDMPASLFGDRYENHFPLKQFTCSAAWSIMHVGPYGTVYPCFSVPMGSLKEQRLSKIWNGKPYREFRRQLKAARIFPGCIGCCVMKRQ